MAEVQIKALKVTSGSFAPGGQIPDKYTCNGDDMNPHIHIGGIPPEAQSLALIMEDENANNFVHWMIWDLPLSDTIKENSTPGIAGKNDFGLFGYRGPCPPTDTHKYTINVYALDGKIDRGAIDTSRQDFFDEISPRILAKGQLSCIYSAQ